MAAIGGATFGASTTLVGTAEGSSEGITTSRGPQIGASGLQATRPPIGADHSRHPGDLGRRRSRIKSGSSPG